ncbi:MAG: SusC/RagA family TonB-linked outer membrane protein [Candidatus Cyclobacteriaceae bacterium M3_2C_046]
MNKQLLKMAKTISVLLLSFVSMTVLAQDLATIRTVGGNLDESVIKQENMLPLKKVLEDIELKFNVSLGYDTKTIEKAMIDPNQLKIDQSSLNKTLSSVLKPLGMDYKMVENNYYVIIKQKEHKLKKIKKRAEAESYINLNRKAQLSAVKKRENQINFLKQTRTITGTVTSMEDNAPLPGVNIIEKGTSNGTVSDVEGQYSLNISEDATIVFSSVGYTSEEIQVGSRSVIDLTMTPDVKQLQELVVVGYGTVKKSDLTGSVASVKAEELTAYPAIGAVQALQGRAAGVQIQANNGEPGADFKIRIRGATSINASSDPLIVVDGFPGGTMPPPEDIESIEILKDASATAIYGSRGANGVIMVTTKRGKDGKAKIDFNSSFSTLTEINRLDLLNGEQFANYINDVYLSNPSNNPDNLPYANPSSFGVGTDWQDVIFQNGSIQNYQLSVSGGNENVGYYVSGVYFDQEGIILNSDYNRFSVTSNIDIKASEKFKLGINLFARRTDRNGVRTQEGSGGTNGAGVISSAFKFEPIAGIYDENGMFTISQIGDPHDNPYALATELLNNNVEDRLQGNFYGEYEILPDLKFRTSIGANIRNARNGGFTPTTLNAGRSRGGIANINTDKDVNVINENYLTYTRQFGSQSFSVMGGYSYQYDQSEGWNAAGSSFISNAFEFWNLNGAAVYDQPSSNISEWELSSFYGRVNYSINEKYLFTINARYDGSSRFAKNNKWAFFPSGAFAWNISQEPFMQNVNPISNLKLRTSFGITGNQAIGVYQSLAKFRTTFAVINGVPVNAVRPQDVANDNLTWESTEQFNIGLDIGLLDDRITLATDYYYMTTYDMLFSQPLPEYSGFGSMMANIGKMENKGFEFEINSRNITGEFTWSSNLNLSINRNKILELPEGEDIRYRSTPGHILTDDTQILSEGYPLGSFYGWIYQGVYQEGDDFLDGSEAVPGGEKYMDLDGMKDDEGNLTGQPDGKLNNDDRTIIGNPNPDFIWGFNNTFSWKGFDLNVFFQSSVGNDMLNFTRFELDWLTGKNNASTAALNRWTPTNTDTDIPKASYSRPARPSTRWIEDGTFVRLKNISLGYNVPKSIVNNIGIRAARVYISGQNILTFTDYQGFDPEVNYQSGGNRDSNQNLGLDYGSYPNAKSYTVGLNIGF